MNTSASPFPNFGRWTTPLALLAVWNFTLLTTRAELAPEEVLAAFESAAVAPAANTPTPHGSRACGSQLIREGLAALPAMTAAQQDRLAHLAPIFSPALKRLRNPGLGSNALPMEPTLTSTKTGPNSIIHFTLTGVDASPDMAYVDTVASTIEAAIKEEGHTFRKAIPEGGGSKLHVYVRDLSPLYPTGADGLTYPVPTVAAPHSCPCFMYINTNLRTTYPTDFRLQLKLTCYHEYMHGVQEAYNYGINQWMSEGQAVWAEVKFGGSKAGLVGFLGGAGSVVNQPERSLWDAGTAADTREYSTGAFMLELESEKGTSIMKKWLTSTESENSAQKALIDALNDAEKFQKIYRKYLLALFQKKIPKLGSAQPGSVPEQPMAAMLGVDLAGTAPPTGAFFRRISGDNRIKNDYWLVKVEMGGAGHPEILCIRNPEDSKKIKVVEPADDYKELDDFNKADESLVILTDTNAPTETAATTTITGQVISPFIKVKNTTAVSPINAGDSSEIHITYDLLGTPPTMPLFPVEVRVVEKGPDVADNASGDANYATGVDQDAPFFFNTTSTTDGHYRFRLTFVTPTESFAMHKIPRSKDESIFAVDVIGSGALPNAAPVGTTRARLERVQRQR